MWGFYENINPVEQTPTLIVNRYLKPVVLHNLQEKEMVLLPASVRKLDICSS